MDDAPLRHLLSRCLGGSWTLRALGASAFCATWQARREPAAGAATQLFVKSTPLAQAPVLEAEADGLAALAATGTVRIPAVAACASDATIDCALLAMEWLPLDPRPRRDLGERLGGALAALHLAAPAAGDGRFGWTRDNWLGATPQPNGWSAVGGLAGWIDFVSDARLGALAERLAAVGAPAALTAAMQRVVEALPGFFDDGHRPRASLIHGDLWSGNWSALADGTPVVYDPAVSVSDPEAELAMMELFGAPPPGFWPAYRATAGDAIGSPAGYVRRRGLYQLYHLLNHALLFGGGYGRQALALAEALARRR